MVDVIVSKNQQGAVGETVQANLESADGKRNARVLQSHVQMNVFYVFNKTIKTN